MSEHRENALLKFLLRNSLIGMAAGCSFAGLVLAFDIAQVGTLVAKSDVGWVAAAMLAIFTGLTFASVQVTFAVLALSEDTKPRGPGKLERFKDAVLPFWQADARPVPVRAGRSRQ